MVQRKKVLFLTNSEHGQANVVLAVAHELLIQDRFDVHIGSFHDLRPRVVELGHSVRSDFPNLCDRSPLEFHDIAGPSMMGAFLQNAKAHDLTHPPGINGAILSYRRTLDMVYAWDGPEYIRGSQSCMEIVKKVDPVVVVVDNGLAQGIDACTTLSRKYIIMTPGSMKDIIGILQPRLAGLWKYPMLSSGFAFPLPWSYIPANIYLLIRLLFIVISHRRPKTIATQRRIHGIPPKQLYIKDVPYLCPSLPEVEFPMTMPNNITSCGPILLRTKAVSDNDADLDKWLQKRPTILMNLGSHDVSSVRSIRHLVRGIRTVLDSFPDVQILWKLKSKKRLDNNLFAILTKELTSGQVKIEEWLTTDPLAILKSGHVICSVHHGGANSYFEAITTGIPQVILPVWLDTYDFAVRVEWLGIGVYGNRSVAPEVDSHELAKAITSVISQRESWRGSIYEKADRLAKICQKNDGRRVACERIMDMAREMEQTAS